jgi:NADPH-dependent glutamate synthase beta subunit-like oxidoreductase/Pyruvate/2-oxoacid:ferredoxin oxidoreductase delta subunit
MSLLKKVDKPKPLRTVARGGASVGTSTARPQQVEKLAPCLKACPAGNNVRGWITVVAQREKNGVSLPDALDKAWRLAVETNPFPAVMGRVCPHPCEDDCNRKAKDGAVGINSIERFLGDWGLSRGLALERLAPAGSKSEKVAVVGAGPAGLSCAYQLARRGYGVTLFESLPEPGGMLLYGIPEYRLPRDVLASEIKRIQDLGVEIRCGVAVGRDVSFESLQKDFAAVFVAVGAHAGKKLGVPGEEGAGVYTGTEFLRRVNMGEKPPVGKKVVVIGGGDTAIDAARVCLRLGTDAADAARRMGAEVTLLYRRTRTEMPAIDAEIVGALEENIKIEFLAAPAKVIRDASGNPVKLEVQKMKLGDPDASGRRSPVPIPGEVAEIECNTLIAAVSQEPELTKLGGPLNGTRWLQADAWGRTSIPKVWSGGDNVELGLATIAVGQGRKAAEAIDASLRGEEPREAAKQPDITPERLKLDYYEAQARAERRVDGASERLARPNAEFDHGLDEAAALAEMARCFSCGLCFGCERCWMFCTPAGFVKLPQTSPGSYYHIKLENCDGCKKCADECPCGFLDMI